MCNLYSTIDMEKEASEFFLRKTILKDKGSYSFEDLLKKNNVNAGVLEKVLSSLRDSGFIEECGSKYLVL